jgi:hypothetical protein
VGGVGKNQSSQVSQRPLTLKLDSFLSAIGDAVIMIIEMQMLQLRMIATKLI